MTTHQVYMEYIVFSSLFRNLPVIFVYINHRSTPDQDEPHWLSLGVVAFSLLQVLYMSVIISLEEPPFLVGSLTLISMVNIYCQ